MRSKGINAPDMTRGMGWALVVGMALFAAPPLSAQSQNMNFFVAEQGPSWGANRPGVDVSDAQCTDLGYPEGYGHLNWRAYLTGTAADSEEAKIARERIGPGPWYNYHGVEIATNLDQLHSDGNNLSLETAVTVKGRAFPEGTLEIPTGSELDGGDYSRQGPFFCFGVP
jgi:hypothetical protein